MKNGQSEQDEHPIGSLVNDVESSITRKSEKNEITKNINIDPKVKQVKIKGIVENKTNEKENKREPTLQTSSNFGLWYTPLYTIIMKQYGESEYRAPLSAVPM